MSVRHSTDTKNRRRPRHPYAYAVESDVLIVLQHSRLDTAPGGYTLFTTIAYGE